MNLFRQLTTWGRKEEDRETSLVEAARQGDRRAFDALARTYERPLRGFLARRVGPCALEDVLQETWLACWTALPRYTGQARFKAWLFGIALHKCTDYYRARGRAAVEIPLEEADRSAADPTDWHVQTELKQTVRQLLLGLPIEQREVLELYYYAELTLAETAEALGRNLNTVKYQFYRAHAQVEKGLTSDVLPETSTARRGEGRNLR